MRVLFLLALFALFGVANASVTFPLSGLDIAVTSTLLGSDANQLVQMNPSFSDWKANNLRYQVEVSSTKPVDFSISIKIDSHLFGTSTVAKVRNCVGSLTRVDYLHDPDNTDASLCQFSPATSLNLIPGQIHNVAVTGVLGEIYIEINLPANVENIPTRVSYVIAIMVDTVNKLKAGAGMPALATDYKAADFDNPVTAALQEYTIDYTIADGSLTSTSIVPVPFYLATQKSVFRILVQECPGRPCSQCDLNTFTGGNTRYRITYESGATDPYFSSSWRLAAGVLPPTNANTFKWNGFVAQYDSYGNALSAIPTANAQHGRYFFPAYATTNNCVRFWNIINNQGTENQKTITINMPIHNCGAWTTCIDCVKDSACGWCITDNTNINAGGGTQCRMSSFDDSHAITGDYCHTETTLIKRFVTSTIDCKFTLRGDPRISGLQGQDFQVHGTPNEYFNLVSSATLQVNSRFVYLDEARCDNFTTCFSHPGTYIDEVGVMMADNQVRIVAGALNEAARVFINGKEVTVSAHKHTAGKIQITFANPRRVVIKTPEFMMTISQSDKFFNIESALLKTELLDQGSKLLKLESSRAAEANTIMHGLIGQTWRNNVYAGGREYEGEVADYQVADGIWGKDFAFNLYH